MNPGFLRRQKAHRLPELFSIQSKIRALAVIQNKTLSGFIGWSGIVPRRGAHTSEGFPLKAPQGYYWFQMQFPLPCENKSAYAGLDLPAPPAVICIMPQTKRALSRQEKIRLNLKFKIKYFIYMYTRKQMQTSKLTVRDRLSMKNN